MHEDCGGQNFSRITTHETYRDAYRKVLAYRDTYWSGYEPGPYTRLLVDNERDGARTFYTGRRLTVTIRKVVNA